jgi:hypothetical protein
MDEVLQFVDKYNSKYNHYISETAFVIPTSELVYIRKHYSDSIPYLYIMVPESRKFSCQYLRVSVKQINSSTKFSTSTIRPSSETDASPAVHVPNILSLYCIFFYFFSEIGAFIIHNEN